MWAPKYPFIVLRFPEFLEIEMGAVTTTAPTYYSAWGAPGVR
jgi:hypothetical protein